MINFLFSSSGSVEINLLSNLNICMSCLNIFFMSILGGLGYKEKTEPRESSSVPKPLYGAMGLYIRFGLGFLSYTGIRSISKTAL